MNGVIVINKEKNYTSRDVVNIIGKHFNTKKIGHTGTLDPIATGVLVLCMGTSLKLVEMLMDHDKEYIAKIKLGIVTDTLDITGQIIKQKEVPDLTKKNIEEVLNSFKGKIKQQVPIYSAIKVNGKKLYEYARNNEQVDLPIKEVEIYDINLISDIIDNGFYIKCHVSSGTYIRSLIRDIGYKLGTVAIMEELERTSLGKFKIEDSYTVDEVNNNNYKLLDIKEVVDLPLVKVDEELEKRILNGQVLKRFFDEDKVMILNSKDEVIAIYQQKDNEYVKPYRMFIK